MLKKTFEWLRIAHAKPDNETVDARQKAVGEILARVDQAKDLSLLSAVVTGTVAGLECAYTSQSPQVASLVESIRKFQPAFPAELSENALDLRVTCALALGELLVRGPKKGAPFRSVLPAALFVAGDGVRPVDGGKHLADALKGIASEAWRVLEAEAVSVRERQEVDLDELAGIEVPNDAPTFWKNLLPALQSCFTTLQDQVRADQEELEVLSWFYREHSDTFAKPLRDLSAHYAALACGSEVGDRILLPPHRGVYHMIVSAVTRGRGKKGELDELPWAKVASALDEQARNLLAPDDDQVTAFVGTAAPILPVTWLAVRLKDSQGAPGWEAEFERKTGLKADVGIKPGAFAEQVFKERVAQRLLATHFEE